jgi:dihydroxyacetone kinase-like predicted kinase
LAVAAADIEKASLKLLKTMQFEAHEILSMFYGQDVEKQVAESVAETIRKAYPKQEVEVHPGGQPHYQFIFSIE